VLGVAFWRLQIIGQRRFTVAEEAVVAFTMARYALDWARNGASFEGEGTTRPKDEYESEETTRLLNGYFTATERLRASEQRFADLEKISLLARHHLGEDAYNAFNTLSRARNRVIISAGMLIRTHRENDGMNESTRKLRERWEDDIWGAQLDDSRLTIEVKEAEAILRAICDREARMTAAFWPFRLTKPHRNAPDAAPR
jgi:hypothetical protein